MRISYLMMTASLFATSAWACPNLAGEFKCAQVTDTDGSFGFGLATTQDQIAGAWTFHFTRKAASQADVSWDVVADGLARRTDSEGESYTETASCTNDTLTMVDVYAENNQTVATYTSALTPNTTDGSITVLSDDGAGSVETIVCKKL